MIQNDSPTAPVGLHPSVEGELCFTVLDAAGVHRLPEGLPDGMLVRLIGFDGAAWRVELVDRGAARLLKVADRGNWLVAAELLERIEPGRICLEWPDDEPTGPTLWGIAIS